MPQMKNVYTDLRQATENHDICSVIACSFALVDITNRLATACFWESDGSRYYSSPCKKLLLHHFQESHNEQESQDSNPIVYVCSAQNLHHVKDVVKNHVKECYQNTPTWLVSHPQENGNTFKTADFNNILHLQLSHKDHEEILGNLGQSAESTAPVELNRDDDFWRIAKLSFDSVPALSEVFPRINQFRITPSQIRMRLLGNWAKPVLQFLFGLDVPKSSEYPLVLRDQRESKNDFADALTSYVLAKFKGFFVWLPKAAAITFREWLIPGSSDVLPSRNLRTVQIPASKEAKRIGPSKLCQTSDRNLESRPETDSPSSTAITLYMALCRANLHQSMHDKVVSS
eukprot:Gregarina_sp_Poly_1__1210@NODE_1298_length_4457_cov_159_361048_g878_i0_p1_GENE_NODE_1298_length_4457_cov_159_361048_g878_i0NODE_1298_length_4457_cov_159_361048_g878_i0_p1_ORF_typecomplete_len343_score26_43_NODE_1298_length_4457_cov_159_361048_g878_i021053133